MRPEVPAVPAVGRRLSGIYALAQTNPYIFASPLGPARRAARPVWVPRFVFFGPHAADDSWRLAFLGSMDASDPRPAHALLGLLEALGADAENGHGLNLTLFPQIAGAAPQVGAGAALSTDSWLDPRAPEIALLAQDARLRGYHGFIRVESSRSDDVPVLSVRTARDPFGPSPDVELVSSVEFYPVDVRFERVVHHPGVTLGPLELAEDLGVQPFELTLRLPASWSHFDYETTATHLLTRFVRQYRAFRAYGGEL